jgi:hypothetical protein
MTNEWAPRERVSSERRFIEVFERTLKQRRWEVEESPLVGPWDILAKSPSGSVYLIECKFTRSSVDFSTVDYLLNVADELRSRTPGVEISPILISNVPPVGVVEDVARKSGVRVMLAEEGPETIEQRLASEG